MSNDCVSCQALRERLQKLEAQLAQQTEEQRMERQRLEQVNAERTAELSQLNERLQVANAELQKQSVDILNHFACMSHEIRTPLVGVVAFNSFWYVFNSQKS